MAHASLLEDIESFTARYVYVPDDVRHVTGLWALHTWTFDAFVATPYLYVCSDDPGVGKTRLIETLSMLVRNPRRADDMTIAVMIRLLDLERCCLFIDEIDTKWSGSRNEPFRQLLSSGYKLGGVSQREMAREVVEYDVFGPKLLAGIRNGCLPRTVMDRCIPIVMKRKPAGVDCDRFREFEVKNSKELEHLMTSIDEFVEDHFVDITAQRPAPMRGLSDRQSEISESLLAISAVLGTEQKTRDCLNRLFADGSGATTATPEQAILARIRIAFDGEPKMHTEDICASLGPSYNGRQLAIWLAPFGILPRDVRIGQRVQKGYLLSQFDEVFRSNLGPELHLVDNDRSAA